MINRILIGLIGLFLILLAARQMQDTEAILDQRKIGVILERKLRMQVLGMAAYEFRMHWRRRTLQVATLSLVALSVIIMLILGGSMKQYVAQFGAVDPNAPQNIVPFFWVPIYFVILVLFGPLMAEVIPLDHQLGVSELLESLPPLRKLSGRKAAGNVSGAPEWN